MYTLNPVSDKVKHTGAHILAAAVSRMRPSAKLGIGPVTKEGFYYDIDLTKPITEKDIPRLEREIDKIIKENLPMQQITIGRDEAMNMLLQKGQIYKAELIKNLPDAEISFYKTGDGFIDLCRGPHAMTTGEVGAIKVTKIDEAYWNEDPSRPKLQRIYGVVFNNKNELDEYYKTKKEEADRDYKVLLERLSYGKSFSNSVLLNWRGATVELSIKQLAYKHLLPQRYKDIILTQASNPEEASQYLDFAFNYKIRSYRDYPLTFKAEVNCEDTLLKDEKLQQEIIFIKKFFYNTDELSVTSEIDKAVDVFKALKIDLKANVYVQDPDNSFVNVVSNILQKEGISHNKIATQNGDKVEIEFRGIDIFAREWNLGQVTFIKNIVLGDVNKILQVEHRINSMAAFLHLLEHTKGELPSIISPAKVIIIPIEKDYLDYAYQVQEFLQRSNIFADVDFRSISLKRKIYLAEKNKSAVQLVVGQKEIANNSVSLRHKNIDQGLTAMEDIVETINNLVRI